MTYVYECIKQVPLMIGKKKKNSLESPSFISHKAAQTQSWLNAAALRINVIVISQSTSTGRDIKHPRCFPGASLCVVARASRSNLLFSFFYSFLPHTDCDGQVLKIHKYFLGWEEFLNTSTKHPVCLILKVTCVKGSGPPDNNITI